MFLGGGFGRRPTIAQDPVMSQRLGKKAAGESQVTTSYVFLNIQPSCRKFALKYASLLFGQCSLFNEPSLHFGFIAPLKRYMQTGDKTCAVVIVESTVQGAWGQCLMCYCQ